jgi:AraC-like DNA-binding protein/mannose-6-phosphate isomerase-like protein (cupin superfamily)
MGTLPERDIEVYVVPGARGQRAGLGLTGPSCLMEEVPFIGWTSLSTAMRFNLPAHIHDGYEIMYLSRGSSEWWVGDSTYELTPGDVYITRPGELHGLVDAVLTPSEYYWIHLEISGTLSFPGVSAEDAQLLVQDLNAIEHRCFAAPSEIADCFRRILEEHRSPDQYSAMSARAALHALLIHLIRSHATHVRRLQLCQTPQSSVIREAMSLIAQRLDEPLSALKIAGNRKMCDSSFHQLFRAEVGWTPVEYRARCRIQRAKEMLRENRLTIFEIAFALGFGSGQYFSTAFKKAVGVTPSTYREQILDGTFGIAGLDPQVGGLPDVFVPSIRVKALSQIPKEIALRQ